VCDRVEIAERDGGQWVELIKHVETAKAGRS
jgi:hypothetical protein